MHVTIDDAPFMEEQKRQISELGFTRMCGAKIHCLPPSLRNASAEKPQGRRTVYTLLLGAV
jgi:hypothetical protein